MKNLFGILAASAAFLALSPASATLQVAIDVSGAGSTCVDNGACDLDPATGIIQLANAVVNGVAITGELGSSIGTPANPAPVNILNISNLTVINRSGALRTITAALSDTDFHGPSSLMELTTSGTFQNSLGSAIVTKWFNDPANTQGAANAFDTPGALVDTFNFAPTSALSSFAYDQTKPFGDPGPFSMTLFASYTLPGGGELISRGQAALATPEPATWASLAIGFAALAGLGMARRRSVRLAAA